MIDRTALLKGLRRELRRLEVDLAEQAESDAEMKFALEAEYRAAREAERVGESFKGWRGGVLTQAAVAWLLACVIVRFAEDNGLVDEALLAGPGERNVRAADRQTLYFRAHPTDSDRDYLLDVFAAVSELPGMARLYDRDHNLIWRHPISGDAAGDLLAFWRAVDPDTGVLRHDFTDPEWDTRFLGDLYQDLSDDARKRFALLQTPEFVEEFILDRTLTPALDEFGLAGTRLIDPACGSGHFLLGAFARLIRAWFERASGTPERALVQQALDGVHGVDINPFAAAIARFRLLVAALRASRIERLKEAPNFRVNVAAGDSLLHGRRFTELDVGSDADQLTDRGEFAHAFQTEDLHELNRILGQQYHVVVGNPPYVTVKDAAVNRLYRARYSTCHRQYSLAVPFTERIFGFALTDNRSRRAGYVGMITANSFMKRQFGKKLIEDFLPTVDLTHVIDTSRAYIPGHGIPTVIVFGRNRSPIGTSVRTVMGIRGEPAIPQDPSTAHVWRAIVGQIDFPQSESDWASTDDVARTTFSSHPWSVGGGAVPELKHAMERDTLVLEQSIDLPIGRGVRIAEEDAFTFDSARFARLRLPREEFRYSTSGDGIRDWSATTDQLVWYPYGSNRNASVVLSELWPWRATLAARKTFQGTMDDAGLNWFEYMQHTPSAYTTPLSVTFAEVSTHNHFVLDRGGKVFKQTAPVIKLPREATEADHLSLVGLLNSSIACFWMKQVFHNKGGGGIGGGLASEEWEQFYQYAGLGLGKFPLPANRPIEIAKKLDHLAAERQAHLPGRLAHRFPVTFSELNCRCDTAEQLFSRMVSLQEELDWECYKLYGIVDEDFRYCDANGGQLEPPPLTLGERAFEIFMARRLAAGKLKTAWFERHGSTPITDLPNHWPMDYRSLVERRIDRIQSDRIVGLVERPEYKRRWNVETWQDQERRVLRDWLLDRLESPAYWPEKHLATARALAERAAADSEFLEVAGRYAGHAGVDIETLVADLVEAESVPALPVQRYKPSGLDKREVWERIWELQRREDNIDADVAATIPRGEGETAEDHATRLHTAQRRRKQEEIGDLAPPPKYRSADFLKPTYWRLRGALDVPKERFVSLPQMGRDSDQTLLVGWAGWNVPELCQAVATYFIDVIEQDGWTATRLIPLLAIIQENLPWLKQWHNDVDPEYNQRLGDFFETFLNSQLSNHGLTSDDLRTWT